MKMLCSVWSLILPPCSCYHTSPFLSLPTSLSLSHTHRHTLLLAPTRTRTHTHTHTHTHPHTHTHTHTLFVHTLYTELESFFTIHKDGPGKLILHFKCIKETKRRSRRN